MIIRYKDGSVCFDAITVAEVITELQKLPQELPVIIEWEGQMFGFNAGRLFESTYKHERLEAPLNYVCLFAE